MHLLCSLVVAFMALFPASDSGGKSLYQRWMEAYEKHLYQQIEENFEREKAETVTFEQKNAVSVQNSEVNNEQTTEEKTTGVLTGSGEDAERIQEIVPEITPAVPEEVEQSDTSYEEMAQVVVTSCTPQMVREVTPLYQVDGYIPDEAIQTYLYTRLCEAGIGWFHPYAICLIAQESTWNPMAENPNGLDKGLLQYRITYWPTLEWWNPYAEIDVFVQQMANRAAIGCTVSDMISRHNQSDWGTYCQGYVDAVMSHSKRLIQIR